jgi:hypothetical protein
MAAAASPQNRACVLATHTAQAFTNARCTGRGLVTGLPRLWTWRWPCGCRHTRYAGASVPPVTRHGRWWRFHPVTWEDSGLSHVPRAHPWGVGLASPPGVRPLRPVREAPLDLTPGLLAHASQPLSRVCGDDGSRRCTCVAPRTPSWSPPPVRRVVAPVAHAQVAIRAG